MGPTAATLLPAATLPPKPYRSNQAARPQRQNFTNEVVAAAILTLLFLVGACSMLPASEGVVRLWLNDPLRSFGAFLPLLSIALWVRQWRAMQWTGNGTAWGLLPIACAILLARLIGTSLIVYSFGQTDIEPIQPGILAFAYGSGLALLLGGIRLWRALLFPLALLFCLDPVPHFVDHFDFPLQQASAAVARGFSQFIGLHPTGQQLQMMFAPKFGMVIVPGCNGVRGAATLAYLALFIAYLRRDRWPRIVLFMAGGFLFGYLLNFARLCVLVVYYRLALAFPQWRSNGETIDYWIGGTLFLLLTTLAGYLLLRPNSAFASQQSVPPRGRKNSPARVAWMTVFTAPRWIVALLLLLATALPETPAAVAILTEPSDYIAPSAAIAQLPATVGPWTRGDLSTEVHDGHPLWQWAHYTAPGDRSIDLALWLSPTRHFAIQSRLMSGSKPVLGGTFQSSAGGNLPMQLSSFTLLDAAQDTPTPIPTFFAETVCRPTRCTEQDVDFQRKGWHIALQPVAAHEERTLRILLRVQAAAGTQEDGAAQQAARNLIRDFSANLDLHSMAEHMGSL